MYESNQVGLVEAYKLFWKNYANFSGRSTRAEYWFATLANLLIYVVLAILTLALKTPILYIIFALAVIIPGLAIAFRRLHDTDRSAGWLFIGFIPFIGVIWLLVLYCQPSTPGSNRFG
jgi:uncharacterized membrane protein YhaH (DUF805 family)